MAQDVERAPYLSVVTPVREGAGFIEPNLRVILEALEELGRPFELIVVCDGPRDGTEELVRGIEDERIRVLHHETNQGKGFAVTRGLLEARGRLVGWLDSDLDIAPEAVVRAARAFEEKTVDAVVGSKRHVDSIVDYPVRRRVYSWGYQLLVRLLFRVRVRDTQVGAKVLRREMVDTVAPLVLVKRYAFDLEFLAVGAEFGFDRVAEIPITLKYRFSGTAVDWDGVYHMLVDTLAIAYRIHVRRWYVRRFAALQRARVESADAGGPRGGAGGAS